MIHKPVLWALLPWILVLYVGSASASAYMSDSREAEAKGVTSIGRWDKVSGFGLGIQAGVNGLTEGLCDGNNLDCYADWAFALIMDYRFAPLQGALPFGFTADIFLENHFAFVGLDPGIMTDTLGLWYQITLGPRFHFLFFDWLDAYVGMGLGYAHFYARGHTKDEHVEGTFKLHGLALEAILGANFYLIEGAPGFGFGPVFRVMFPYWVTGCYNGTDLGQRYASWAEDDKCKGRGSMNNNPDDIDETSRLPNALFFGLDVSYHFN